MTLSPAAGTAPSAVRTGARRALVISHSFVERDARVARTVSCLLEEGWAVDVLALDTPRREGSLRTWRVPMERRRGSLPRYLFEYGWFFLAAAAWISWRVLRERVDLVYVNSPPDAFVFSAVAARLRRIPVVLDVHDPMPELFLAKRRRSELLHRALTRQERWGARFADRVVTVHEPLRDLLRSRNGDRPISVVMNVPDTAGWEEVAWNPQSRLLVFSGSIAFRYGLDDLVRAMALLGDRVPDLRLRLIGEGEDLGRLLRLADELGVGDRIEYRGVVTWDRIREEQKDAWVGVNAPKPDSLGNLSFSNKVVEWVAMGVPVVAARTPLLERYFPEGTLWYVEGGSPESIAEALATLAGSPVEAVRQRMEAAREALERIAWPVQRRQLMTLVDSLTDGGAGR